MYYVKTNIPTNNSLSELSDEVDAATTKVTNVESSLNSTNTKVTSVENSLKTTNTKVTNVESSLKTTNTNLSNLDLDDTYDEKVTYTYITEQDITKDLMEISKGKISNIYLEELMIEVDI